MKKALYPIFVTLLPAFILFASLPRYGYALAAQAATSTPVAKATVLAQGKPGNTDGIAFLGIIIFVVILLAIAFHASYLRSEER